MTVHSLKTWPHEHDAVKRNAKTFEVRGNLDRDFAEGDTLLLRRWDPAARVRSLDDQGAYVDVDGDARDEAEDADTIEATVTYVLHGGRFGLPPGVCVMAIARVDRRGIE